MSSRVGDIAAFTHSEAPQKTAFKVLLAISFCHLLNDMSQSLLPLQLVVKSHSPRGQLTMRQKQTLLFYL